MFSSVNPVSGEVISNFKCHSEAKVKSIISASNNSFHEFRLTNISNRCDSLFRFRNELASNIDKLAILIVEEMGKPILQAKAEITKSISLCEYYIKIANKTLEPEYFTDETINVELRHEPLGVVFGIMPWNFPIWQCLRFAVPTILSGNSVILKPAPNTAGCALLLEQLFYQSFECDVFRVALLETKLIKNVINNPLIRGVSLTGSVTAGSKLASLAGQYIKKSVLELGGSDPFIVFNDSDLELAVKSAVKSRMNNTGQTCLAAKRIFVQKEVYKEFKLLIENEIRSLKVGNPYDESTQISTLAKSDVRDKLQMQFDQALFKGAKIIVEGGTVNGPGFYFRPVLLENIKKDMLVYHQEVFGPICIIIPFNDKFDALKLANDTIYGLGASIWTHNVEIQKFLSNNLQTGFISINDYVRSDPKIPFGGVKNSGYGKELGECGLKEFTNLKSIISK